MNVIRIPVCDTHLITLSLCTQCLGLLSRKATQVPGAREPVVIFIALMLTVIAIILLLTRMMLVSDFSSPTLVDVAKIIPSLTFS